MKPSFNPRFRKFASQAVQWFIQKFRQEGMKGESESPIHGPPDENYLKSIFGSVSYCAVILRTTPHWSVKMTSCNFRLLTWEQQIKITFAAWKSN